MLTAILSSWWWWWCSGKRSRGLWTLAKRIRRGKSRGDGRETYNEKEKKKRDRHTWLGQACWWTSSCWTEWSFTLVFSSHSLVLSSSLADLSGRKPTILFTINEYKRKTKHKWKSYNVNKERHSPYPMIRSRQWRMCKEEGRTNSRFEWDEHERGAFLHTSSSFSSFQDNNLQ